MARLAGGSLSVLSVLCILKVRDFITVSWVFWRFSVFPPLVGVPPRCARGAAAEQTAGNPQMQDIFARLFHLNENFVSVARARNVGVVTFPSYSDPEVCEAVICPDRADTWECICCPRGRQIAITGGAVLAGFRLTLHGLYSGIYVWNDTLAQQRSSENMRDSPVWNREIWRWLIIETSLYDCLVLRLLWLPPRRNGAGDLSEDWTWLPVQHWPLWPVIILLILVSAAIRAENVGR